MKTLRIPSRVALFVGAMVLVLQIPLARTAGAQDAGVQAGRNGRAEVSFTKWVLTAGANPTYMRGFTGRDIEGIFVGETFVNMARANPEIPSLSYLEVIYGVQANEASRSFTALIRGGASLGKAQLDGRILAGWRTGAQVHVEWTRMPSPSEKCLLPPPGAGPFCFVGTMTIEPLAHDVE